MRRPDRLESPRRAGASASRRGWESRPVFYLARGREFAMRAEPTTARVAESEPGHRRDSAKVILSVRPTSRASGVPSLRVALTDRASARSTATRLTPAPAAHGRNGHRPRVADELFQRLDYLIAPAVALFRLLGHQPGGYLCQSSGTSGANCRTGSGPSSVRHHSTAFPRGTARDRSGRIENATEAVLVAGRRPVARFHDTLGAGAIEPARQRVRGGHRVDQALTFVLDEKPS